MFIRLSLVHSLSIISLIVSKSGLLIFTKSDTIVKYTVLSQCWSVVSSMLHLFLSSLFVSLCNIYNISKIKKAYLSLPSFFFSFSSVISYPPLSSFVSSSAVSPLLLSSLPSFSPLFSPSPFSFLPLSPFLFFSIHAFPPLLSSSLSCLLFSSIHAFLFSFLPLYLIFSFPLFMPLPLSFLPLYLISSFALFMPSPLSFHLFFLSTSSPYFISTYFHPLLSSSLSSPLFLSPVLLFSLLAPILLSLLSLAYFPSPLSLSFPFPSFSFPPFPFPVSLLSTVLYSSCLLFYHRSISCYLKIFICVQYNCQSFSNLLTTNMLSKLHSLRSIRFLLHFTLE